MLPENNYPRDSVTNNYMQMVVYCIPPILYIYNKPVVTTAEDPTCFATGLMDPGTRRPGWHVHAVNGMCIYIPHKVTNYIIYAYICYMLGQPWTRPHSPKSLGDIRVDTNMPSGITIYMQQLNA